MFPTARLMIASVSPYERERFLRHPCPEQLRRMPVETAEYAANLLKERSTQAALVMDSGLLFCDSDTQWRDLVEAHPELPVILRALIAADQGPLCERSRRWIVHPEDWEGLLAVLACELSQTGNG